MCRVALIGQNTIEYIEQLLDIWNNGDCAVLIDVQIPVNIAFQLMVEASVKKCIVEQKLFNTYNSTYNSDVKVQSYKTNDTFARLLPDKLKDKYKPNYSSQEAVVIYSSGTTGKAKGIILSHFALSTNADAIIEYMQPHINDCIYIVRPLSHSSTLTGELLVSFKTKCKLLIAPTIVPPRYILKNICVHKVTILCVNPFLLSWLCNERKRNILDNISSLKVIYSSGSILNKSIRNEAIRIFKKAKVLNVYGLTEAGPRVSAQSIHNCVDNSVGREISGVKIKIISEDGSIQMPGVRGIVHVKTPSQYSGYVSGEIKHHSLYKDWLNTGDIGYIDCHGNLHIVNRIDDVIFVGAHKIYPNDVMEQIMKFARLDECLITSVKISSLETLCCLYTGSLISTNELIKKLKDVLMPHEIPQKFIQTKTIPKSTNGKILTKEAKELIIKQLKENEYDIRQYKK